MLKGDDYSKLSSDDEKDLNDEENNVTVSDNDEGIRSSSKESIDRNVKETMTD